MIRTIRANRLCSSTRVACAAGLALGLASGAAATTYSVSPTRVVLTTAMRSQLVTIKNESDRPLRFQLSMMAWSQDPAGAMQLAPTEDVVYFPSLLTLEKGEERKVRVGTAVPAGSVERSYRLFIEELPPAERPDQSGVVRILTRTSIPVFVQPSKPTSIAVLESLALAGSRFSFVLRNTGTTHVPPLVARVTASDAPGQAVFERDVNVWYVLHAGTRAVDLDLPKERCREVRALEVTAQVEGQTVSGRLPTPGGACASK